MFFTGLAFAVLLLREKRLRAFERQLAVRRVAPTDHPLVESGHAAESVAHADRGASVAATAAVAMARVRQILLCPVVTPGPPDFEADGAASDGRDGADGADAGLTCSICLGNAADSGDGVSLMRRTACGHVFHDVCLLELVTASLTQDQHPGVVLCPNCRSELV